MMISLQNISKTFKTGQMRVEAVKDVCLDIKKGEVFGIIGFSGAGKSTLVRCINLLERPEKGKVIIDGTEITSLSENSGFKIQISGQERQLLPLSSFQTGDGAGN